ncbi:MAG: hypothetical protein WC299_12990 [Kiritimatiellia bacterium]
MKIKDRRYRMPLCPYLAIGNGSTLITLDVYGMAHSLQWPCPGAADRLAWRDFADEWPYWEEMDEELIRVRAPYFRHADGSREYLHEASVVESSYLDDTNILRGAYRLSRGAAVEMTSFVNSRSDVWVRRFEANGNGTLVLQGEFFEKAVRGHAMGHLGHVKFSGIFDAEPRGTYVIVSDIEVEQKRQRVELPVQGGLTITLYMCMAKDRASAINIGAESLAKGFKKLRDETAADDRAWISRAKKPVSKHPFVLKNYRRWLLSNRLMISREGVSVCGVRPFWTYAWPRDASQQAAAFAAAGYLDIAQGMIKWNLDITPKSGVHDARYWADGSPVRLDNRARQGDSAGFLLWAAGLTLDQKWDGKWAQSIRKKLFFIADHLVRDKDPATLLPLPESDHKEMEAAESISLAVSAIGGLAAAAKIARKLKEGVRSKKYEKRAGEIREAIAKHLWSDKEDRLITSIKPLNEKPDVAVWWGASIFKALDPSSEITRKSVMAAHKIRWRPETGGVIGGIGTPYEAFWMYYTAILLLGVAAIGNRKAEREILSSLDRNICPQGLIPEQIGSSTGNLWGTCPIAPGQADLLLYAYRQGWGCQMSPGISSAPSGNGGKP